jgi:DNA topoisomerase I
MVLANISHRALLNTVANPAEAAKVVRLIYVSNFKDGITRTRKGKQFSYYYNGKKVTDKKILERIRKLVIPPAWTDVWICKSENGHIQATGHDLRGRKQYRYHHDWNELRNKTKYHRLYEFGKVLPQLRKAVKKDIADKELSSRKVIATVINLMEETYIRIGSNGYEKMYGSYGMTTMKNRHVTINGGQVRFCFTGKKGIEHTITLKNKKLARIVKQCRDIPGKELFQYYDADGNRHPIDSGMVNSYLKENAAGMDVSAKDFRTWAGSLQSLKSFRSMEPAEDAAAIKKNIISMLDEVSTKLGNTRTVCRKYYVHPKIMELYEEGKLLPLIEKTCMKKKSAAGLTKEESALMCVLKHAINSPSNK